MKKIFLALSFFSVLFLGMLAMSSCVKMKFEDMDNHSAEKFVLPANAKVMSVEAFKGGFPGNLEQIPYPYVDEFSGDTVEVYLYVEVIGNDMSGNLYKNIYVRDASVENGHAINMSVDKTGLYNFYPIGQKFYIRCSGLYIGRYNGLPQLGYIYNGGIGRMADALFDSHVYKDGGVPNLADMPKPIEIAVAGDLKPELLNQLVILKNVKFSRDDVGLAFAPAPPVGENPTSTDRTMIFSDGSEVKLRTSSACRFSSKAVPDSIGDVICIYTVFGSAAQMYIRSFTDIFPDHGFKWDVLPYNIKRDTLLNVPFSNRESLSPFVPISISGAAGWGIGTQNGVYAMMQGRVDGVNEENEDWLISEAIDLSKLSYDELIFTVDQALNYRNQQPMDNYTVKISSNYDPASSNPASAQWTNLDVKNLPLGSDFNFVHSNADMLSFAGKNVHIAFVYKSSGEAAATWEIKNVMIIGQKNSK